MTDLEQEQDLRLQTIDPRINEFAISLVRLADGSWTGEYQRFGKLVSVREAKPEDCLVKLLIHG